jgi:hypothetical protein
MDTGFYRCEASNGHTVTNGESMVKVHRSGSGSGRKKPDPKQDSDDDYDNDGSDPFGKHCFNSKRENIQPRKVVGSIYNILI